jgi:hypothetical protein
MRNKPEKVRFQEWEGLLAGLLEAAPRAARLVPLHAELKGALREAQEIREGREVFLAAAAEARENLARVVRRGHDAAMTARAYLKYYYGPYNDELTRFGVNPIRRGKGRKGKRAGSVPAVGEAGER